MLYNEHTKTGKELQKKIAKLIEEGKDPNLPQPSPRSSNDQHSGSTSASYLPPRARLGNSSYPIDESYMVLGQQASPLITFLGRTILNGMKPESQDTFAQFWRNLEGMLDNLSQPVAFATAPLARVDNTSEGQSNLDGNAGATGEMIQSKLALCIHYTQLFNVNVTSGHR
jgi:hypothetical protein